MIHAPKKEPARCGCTGRGKLQSSTAKQSFCSNSGQKKSPPALLRLVVADERLQIRTAIKFLELCGPADKPTVGTGFLKHIAEDWGALFHKCPYISNDAMIAAATELNWIIKRYDYGCVAIGINEHHLEQVCKRLRLHELEKYDPRVRECISYKPWRDFYEDLRWQKLTIATRNKMNRMKTRAS